MEIMVKIWVRTKIKSILVAISHPPLVLVIWCDTLVAIFSHTWIHFDTHTRACIHVCISSSQCFSLYLFLFSSKVGRYTLFSKVFLGCFSFICTNTNFYSCTDWSSFWHNLLSIFLHFLFYRPAKIFSRHCSRNWESTPLSRKGRRNHALCCFQIHWMSLSFWSILIWQK